KKNPGKGGVIAAAGILVAVLLLAWVGYGMLSGQVEEGGDSNAAAATQEPDALQLALFDATVYDDGNAPVTLTALAENKPLVINFWATWCPYCLQEMDDFQAIYDDYKDKVNFAFVDVADGQRETVEMARAWMADNGHTLPVYYDTKLEAVSSFGLQAYPTTVVVSAQGEVLTISPGVIDPDRMRAALDSLVAG
ncbi:MAG: TlpA disulfide reductase family protein, partial [Coriobacteriia bacterium]|nr:TlpA disulfide reductase family protein [Coriobacteriia bacterium]